MSIDNTLRDRSFLQSKSFVPACSELWIQMFCPVLISVIDYTKANLM